VRLDCSHGQSRRFVRPAWGRLRLLVVGLVLSQILPIVAVRQRERSIKLVVVVVTRLIKELFVGLVASIIVL
jgi:hypothetical protein